MLKHWLRLALIICLFCLNVSGSSAEAPSSGLIETSECHIEKKFEVFFTSEKQKDQVQLAVEGNPCAQGILTISVFSNGRLIFAHEGKASDLLVDPKGITIGLFSESLDSGMVVEERSGSWPAYVSKINQDQFDETYMYSVTEEVYLDYRRRDLPALAITEDYGFTSHIVYDPVAGKSIKVWGSGL